MFFHPMDTGSGHVTCIGQWNVCKHDINKSLNLIAQCSYTFPMHVCRLSFEGEFGIFWDLAQLEYKASQRKR